MRRFTMPVLTILLAAAAVAIGADRAEAQAHAGREAAEGLPPAGFGSLSQNDIAVRLRNDDVEVRIVPLDERLLRLLARDAYASLSSLAASRQAQIDEIARRGNAADPGVALVSFFGQRDGVRFEPELVTVQYRGREFRPIGVVPFTPGFTNQQLNARQQASAVFVFEQELPVLEPMTITYGPLRSNEWERVLPRIERERSRVAAQARQAAPHPVTVRDSADTTADSTAADTAVTRP